MITVSGNLFEISGSASTASFVRFWLRGTGGNQPFVSGTALLAPDGGNTWFADFLPNGSGAVTGSLYSTSQVTVGGVTGAIYYGMQVFQNGFAGPESPVSASGNININSPNILTVLPVVASPTGDSTYARLDSTNQPFTGGITALSVNGVMMADRFSGADAAAKIANAIAALPLSGGTVDARGLQGAQSWGSTVNIGKPVELLLGAATYTGTTLPMIAITNNPTGGVNISGSFYGVPDGSTVSGTTLTSSVDGFLINASGSGPSNYNGPCLIRQLNLVSTANGASQGSAGLIDARYTNQLKVENCTGLTQNTAIKMQETISARFVDDSWVGDSGTNPNHTYCRLYASVGSNSNNILIRGGRASGAFMAIDGIGETWEINGLDLEFNDIAIRTAISNFTCDTCHFENSGMIWTNAATLPTITTSPWTDNGGTGSGWSGEVVFRNLLYTAPAVGQPNGIAAPLFVEKTGVSFGGQLVIEGADIVAGTTALATISTSFDRTATTGIQSGTKLFVRNAVGWVDPTTIPSDAFTNYVNDGYGSFLAEMWQTNLHWFGSSRQANIDKSGKGNFNGLDANSAGLGNAGAISGASTLAMSGLLTKYNNINTAGNGVAATYAATSQKAETAADTNVLTFTPPASAGMYRISFVMSVSAANTATLGWTASWKDSNGNARTPTNLSLFQEGAAAPALTFTTSAIGTYYATTLVDIDNSATNIVVKLTFTGTSFAAKVSATIERIQ